MHEHNATQPSATQRNAVQRNATQCNATQPSATQRNAVQHNATQCNAMQRNACILAHRHTGTHARTHARTHACMHAHTHVRLRMMPQPVYASDEHPHPLSAAVCTGRSAVPVRDVCVHICARLCKHAFSIRSTYRLLRARGMHSCEYLHTHVHTHMCTGVFTHKQHMRMGTSTPDLCSHVCSCLCEYVQCNVHMRVRGDSIMQC